MIKDDILTKGGKMVDTLYLTPVLKYCELLELEVCQDSKG